MFSVIILVAAAISLCGGFYLRRGRKYQALDHVGEMDFPHVNDLQKDFPGVEPEKRNGGAQYVEGEVVFSADSEEEAERIADSVNGRLKSWQDGIAVMSIEETVDEFLKKYSNSPDLPAMYPNYIYSVN